jgi:hypothetical protein
MFQPTKMDLGAPRTGDHAGGRRPFKPLPENLLPPCARLQGGNHCGSGSQRRLCVQGPEAAT